MKEKILKEIKILPSVTTTRGSDWREKIKEVREIGIEEIAIFLTCLDYGERNELYKLVEKAGVENIPLVHLRNDMKIEELDFLFNNYGTKVFCTHTEKEHLFINDHSKYAGKIFIENSYYPLEEKELNNFGGICLDLSHLENDRIFNKEIFEHDLKIMEKIPIGCNHISVVDEGVSHIDELGKPRCAYHQLKDFSKLDYLKKYPSRYFSNFIAIELENSIKDQLKAKDYITNLITDIFNEPR